MQTHLLKNFCFKSNNTLRKCGASTVLDQVGDCWFSFL